MANRKHITVEQILIQTMYILDGLTANGMKREHARFSTVLEKVLKIGLTDLCGIVFTGIICKISHKLIKMFK